MTIESILIFYIVISEVKLRCVMQENFVGSFSLLFFAFDYNIFLPMVLRARELRYSAINLIPASTSV